MTASSAKIKKMSANLTNIPPKRRTTGWSPERRAKHAASIKLWAPWAKSTGPRTAGGKQRSAQNAYKHGGYAAPMKSVKAALWRQSRFVRSVHQLCRLKRAKVANELLNRYELALQKEGFLATLQLISALKTFETVCDPPNGMPPPANHR